MYEMDINKILSKYTRKDFIEILESEKYGEAAKSGWVCPSSVGLKDLNDCETAKTNCKGCWLRAIKKLQFKGEKLNEKR